MRYLIRRAIISVVSLWGVLSLTFFIMHMAPGDPTSIYLRPEIDPAVVENLRHQLGLDLPIWQQYLRWGSEFGRGNFGISFTQQRPVADILREALPNTLQLTLAVFIFQFAAGIALGIVSALKRHTPVDHTISVVLLFLFSIPGFWLALMAILVFSYKLGWLPASHMQSFTVGEVFLHVLGDRVRHLVLPFTVLAAPFVAQTTRYVRSSFAEVLQQDSIRAAKAFGLPTWKIYFKYGLKNALLPLVSLLGLYLPFLLGGTVIIESVFSWPGMGSVTIEAVFSQDYPVILATTFIAAASVIVGNFISDLLYSLADPRIRQGSLQL